MLNSRFNHQKDYYSDFAIESLELQFENKRIHVKRCLCPSAEQTVLILHGAGDSSSRGFVPFHEYLHSNRYSSVSFDFIGHGKSEGSKEGSSLRYRTEQILFVVQSLKLLNKLSIIGFSMGAYNALKVSTVLDVPRLALAIPAVYADEAERLPFGPDFTTCIRKKRSWARSTCFKEIKKFRGKLLIISAEKDAVIPNEIPCRLLESSTSSQSAEHFRVMKSGHDLAEHFVRFPNARAMMLSSILRWLE